MYSSSLLRLIGLSFLLFVLALVLGNPVLLTSSIFFLLVGLLGSFFAPPTRVTITRNLSRGVCWSGDVIEVRRELETSGGLGIVFVHDKLPEVLQLVSGNNYKIVWKWIGSKSYDLSYQVRCPKRGTHKLEKTRWMSQDPLGMRRQSSGSAGDDLEISVISRVGNIVRLVGARSIETKDSPYSDLLRVGISTTDFVELRNYTPGDAIRTINWKASARSSAGGNELLVNRYHPEGRMAVWIFLDCADYMDVGTSLLTPLEHAVEAAGTLAWFYLSRGYTLGAYTYNCPSGYLFPNVGMQHFHRFTKMLTTLQTGGERDDLLGVVERCKSFLFRLEPEIFLISRLDVHYPRHNDSGESLQRFETAIRRLVALGSKPNVVSSVKVINVVLQEYLPPESPLAGQALSFMRWEAQPPLKNVQRAGATVLQWNPLQEEFSKVLLRQINIRR